MILESDYTHLPLVACVWISICSMIYLFPTSISELRVNSTRKVHPVAAEASLSLPNLMLAPLQCLGFPIPLFGLLWPFVVLRTMARK